MNEERMPINLYTIDYGEGNNELTEGEFKKQKQEDCIPWIFLIGVCVVFCSIFVFINVRLPEVTTVWVWTLLYVLLVSLFVLSITKIRKIMKAR
jgi:uncharacterized protein (DUF983 family)